MEHMIGHMIKIHCEEGFSEFMVESGTNLLQFLNGSDILAGVENYCNGSGTCGKCRVKVMGQLSEPSEKERELLGESALEKGFRLACYVNVSADIDVFLQSPQSKAQIVTEGKQIDAKPDPLIVKKSITLKAPNTNDQASDLERLAAVERGIALDIEGIREISDVMRQKDYQITTVRYKDKVIAAEPGDTSDKIYGIAVDIGTTTVVGYLLDLLSGRRIDVYSIQSPQKRFGADVISRIAFTMESDEALERMNQTIIDSINDIIGHLAENRQISREDIYAATFVGNTTMMHFLIRLPAKNIAVSPFIPVTTQMHEFKASQLGIRINRHGVGIVLPSVSAYIGADTVAAVLASGMYEQEDISLLMDIGTNGEIVLGNSRRMYTCSAAAGPAFEGANIRNGVAGIAGAIDKVRFTPIFQYTTINDAKPIGICGSGIVDIISEMLASGIIDETGRIPDAEELDASVPEELKKRLIKVDGFNAFIVEKNIAITQKDVRELQNAKAAIAAGVRILVAQAGIRIEDIKKVFLAGGFGNYIDIESALNIGLLPKELRGRIESIGNAAGIGAIESLISGERLGKVQDIKAKMEYIELSACAEFTDEYVENMMFE